MKKVQAKNIPLGFLTFFLGALLPVTAYFFFVTDWYAISLIPFISLSVNFVLAIFFGVKAIENPRSHPMDSKLGKLGLLLCVLFVVSVLFTVVLLTRQTSYGSY